MSGQEYRPYGAVQAEIARAMQSLGLRPDWRLADRRPPPAGTFDEQMARIAMSGEVVRLVRQRMPITTNERYLLYRLVDRAMAERERQSRPTVAPAIMGVTDAAFIAYRNAGGGGWGTFAEFRLRFTGDDLDGMPEPEREPEPDVVPMPQARQAPPPRRPQEPAASRSRPAPRPQSPPPVPLVIRRKGAAAHG